MTVDIFPRFLQHALQPSIRGPSPAFNNLVFIKSFYIDLSLLHLYVYIFNSENSYVSLKLLLSSRSYTYLLTILTEILPSIANN